MKKSEGVKKLRKKRCNSTKVKGLVVAILVSFTFSAVVCPCACAASMWSMTYGGTGNEIGTGETLQTSDGGYAISGDTNSSGAGGVDFWLFKTDEFGSMQWEMTYGGAQDETSGEMCQTSDGGYALAGGTYSFGVGDSDFWLVKTDSSGNMQWNNTYGGADYDFAYSIVQTSDGGYALFGVTESFGVGGEDFWLVKTDSSGNMQWNRTYGGTGNDHGTSVVQSSDGGYAVSGYTNSFGAGNTDYWLVKTDASGTMEWNNTYGGTGIDSTYQLSRTSDGGYAMAGYSTSFGGVGAYLVKTDSGGNMQWNNTYWSPSMANSLIQTFDGGFALIGFTSTGGQDIYFVKTDASGNMEWNKTYGGTGVERAYTIIQTIDGGYALTGYTTSFGAGGEDIWLVKTDEYGLIPEGLSIGVMLLLSTVASIVGIRILRKQSKWKRW
jgi:predicted secreted protein